MDVPEVPAKPSEPADKSPRKRAAGALKFFLRWGIAVLGIWWVISQMSFSDTILVANPSDPALPVVQHKLAEADAREDQPSYHVVGRAEPIPRDDVLNKPGKKNQKIEFRDAEGKTVTGTLLGLDIEGDLSKHPIVERFYVKKPDGTPIWIGRDRVPNFELKVPYPRVDVGIARLVRQASQKNLWMLILAIVLFPITFTLCSWRWHELLKALQIHIGVYLAFTLTMVGAFYNTFLPGSTGGDVLKALYVSRHTPYRTRAVMSVLIDRIIGMLALIMLGGCSAATQWHVPQCRHIAIVCFGIIACVAAGLCVFYQPTLHRLFGLEWIISHMPKQKQVRNAVEVLEIYRKNWRMVGAAFLVTFPVHMTVVISATCCGKAFGLPLDAAYYWAIVPIIVLVGSLPISPQGAGVMEYFAIKLTETRGATISQAFALTMSIRLVQILWNLTGAYFVMRGHFHAPTEADREEAREDMEEGDLQVEAA